MKRLLPAILAFALAAMPSGAAPANQTAAGLRELQKTCFPAAKTARLVTFEWLGQPPEAAFERLPREPNSVWLVNETPTGGTLILENSVPTPVEFSENSALPGVRCTDADPNAASQALIQTVAGSNPLRPNELGNALLFACLANLANHPATPIVDAVFAKSSSPVVPIAWALSQAADGQYSAALAEYIRNGDLERFRETVQSILKRFPESWSSRPGAVITLENLPPETSQTSLDILSPEDRATILEVVNHSKNRDLQQAMSPFWVTGLPKDTPDTPISRLLRRGPDAVRLLATVLPSDLPTRFTGNAFGLQSTVQQMGNDPLETDTGDDSYRNSGFPHPLTLGEVSAMLLRPLLRNRHQDLLNPSSLQTEAHRWMEKFGTRSGRDLLEALLADLTPEEKNGNIFGLFYSGDPQWDEFLIEYLNNEPANLNTLGMINVAIDRRGTRFHPSAKTFLAKLPPVDTLLAEVNQHAHDDPKVLAAYREQIEEIIAKIRRQLDSPIPTPTQPSNPES